MITEYNTVTFADVYPSVKEFIEGYNTNGIPTTIKEESIRTLYFLMLARFANNPISNQDLKQFELKLFSIVFQYAPTWEKRLSIQNMLRSLSEEDLMTGATNIYNTALNPGSEPSTSTTDELEYVNQQNVNKFKRSKMDAYSMLWSLLRVDVTEELLNKFTKLFKSVVASERPLLYSDEDCEED